MAAADKSQLVLQGKCVSLCKAYYIACIFLKKFNLLNTSLLLGVLIILYV